MQDLPDRHASGRRRPRQTLKSLLAIRRAEGRPPRRAVTPTSASATPWPTTAVHPGASSWRTLRSDRDLVAIVLEPGRAPIFRETERPAGGIPPGRRRPSRIDGPGKPATMSALAEPVIRLEGITKEYPMGAETVHALRGVDLAIGPNELVAIMGPSGSGKSTLMNILGCLDVPTRGPLLARRPGRGAAARSRSWRGSGGGRSGSSSRRSSSCRGRRPCGTSSCR